jgi:hypothetical protein
MKDHHLKYNGDPLVIRTLNACNLKKQDLPKIPELWDEANKKSNVCWSHLLGRCTHGDNCYQGKKGGHVHAGALQPDFVATTCKLIKPGVDWMVTNGESLNTMRRTKRKRA